MMKAVLVPARKAGLGNSAGKSVEKWDWLQAAFGKLREKRRSRWCLSQFFNTQLAKEWTR